MISHSFRTVAAGWLTFLAGGCGGTDTSAPIMVEPMHSHYHVHAVDASHQHSHADGAMVGHVHSHQHADEDKGE
jgi:hypothetical protein